MGRPADIPVGYAERAEEPVEEVVTESTDEEATEEKADGDQN